jgi:F-type H+-transporting ATPase subunit delta
MNVEAVARRYAVALIDSVPASERTAVGEALAEAARLLTGGPAWDVMRNPTIAAETKQRLVRRLFGDDGPVVRLLLVLVKNRREVLLPVLAEQYAQEMLERQGLVAARVRSAGPLDSVRRERLEAALQRRLGRGIRATYEVDPSLLGGVEVRLLDRLWDGTVKGRLERLKAKLKREVGTGEA